MGKRIGLYGGSFNPIHFGHLRCAEEVRQGAGLECVRMIPAHLPPHKDAREIAPGEARRAMLQLAVADTPGLEVDDIELQRAGPSFTIDTIRALKEREPAANFALIVGFDTFREFHTWKDYEAIFGEVDMIVTSRPPNVVLPGENAEIIGRLPIAVTRAFCYDASIHGYSHRSGHRLDFFPVTGLDISASAIRAAIACGESARFLMPASALSWLAQAGLYREDPEGPATP